MSFEADFRSAILAGSGVAALVGDRVNWAELPAARPRPLIALWNITRPGDYTMDGPSGLEQAFIQIDCWADTYLEASTLADTVKAALEALNDTVGSTQIQGVFFTGRRDGRDPMAGAPAQRYSRVSLDCGAWFGAA